MCLNWKGLATVKARLMSSFIISMYAWYTLMARRASPLACNASACPVRAWVQVAPRGEQAHRWSGISPTGAAASTW